MFTFTKIVNHENANLSMDDWDDFQDVMTDTEEEAKVKENYHCWMSNYITGCSSCPPCPEEDPFE